MFISFLNKQLFKPWYLMSNCDFALSAYKVMLLILILGLMKKKKYMLYIWITKGYYYDIRGEKNTLESIVGAGEGL